MVTYLHPLPVGLHVEDDAGVGFGQSVPVRDAFTGESQLHFGQTGTAEKTQRIRRRVIEVTHGGGRDRKSALGRQYGSVRNYASDWLIDSAKTL